MITRITMAVLAMLAVSALLMSCADVPSTGPTPPEYRAQFRFLHAATDVGSVQVSVDGAALGSVNFAENLAHREFPAGSRTLTLSTNETMPVAMPTDERGTIVLLAASGGQRETVRLTERRIFDTPKVAVRVANFNSGEAVDVFITGADTVEATGLAYKDVSAYSQVPAGDYNITVRPAGNDTTVLAASSISVSTSHTSVLLGTATAVSVSNLADN